MTCWNEQVRHLPLVLLPRFSILRLALLNVAIRSVGDHDGEEKGIKPRKWAVEPRNQSPRQCKIHVRGVVEFARIPVYTNQHPSAEITVRALTYTIHQQGLIHQLWS